MSMMPFDMIGPILQSPAQAGNLARVDEAERNRQSEQARDQAKVREAAENSIGTADEDTEVNPDTLGAGGQGRAFGDADETAENQDGSSTPGLTQDEDGQYHLDIEA